MIRVLLFILLFSNLAQAEQTVVNVDGLSFECRECRKRDDNFCEVPWQGKTLTVLCDSLYQVLLQRAYEQKAEKYPKNEELLGLLAKTNQAQDIQVLAFKLLLTRRLNLPSFNLMLDLLLTKNYALIEDAIINNLFSASQNLILWQVRSRLRTKDAFLLAKNIPNKGMDEFLKDLTVVDYADDISLLARLLNSNILNSGERTILTELHGFIENCAIKFECEANFNSSTEIDKYSKRLQNSIISEAAIKHRLSDPIRLLSKIEYVNHRTPETHQALLAILVELKEPFDQVWDSMSAEEKDFISFMASNDTRIAEIVYSEKTSDFNYIQIWLFGVLCIVVASVFYFYYRKVEEVNENVALRSELKELSAIWDYFDLPPDASLGDLKKRYREKARELHPDGGNESSEDFLRLNNYYKKAISLLGK